MNRSSDIDRTVIVAEISANHGQDFKRAVSLIKEAKRCGADAVKFQLYAPDTLTLNIDNRYFRVRHHSWGGQTLYELYKKAHTPHSWFKRLKRISDDEGILFFATAFDKKGVDLLERLDVPFHKIASFELVDLPLIEYAAKTRKPLILSTGMADLREIRDAFNAATAAGAREITLLKCVSSYPAKPEEMNLRTIFDMKRRFRCAIGLSDHTLGTAVSLAAVSLGARMVEKHFTLSRKIKTPDSFFSTEPGELKGLIEEIRIVESALGKAHYGLTPEEKKNRQFRRSLFCAEDIKKGDVFTEKNVRSIRPGYGLSPKYLKAILGKKAKMDVFCGSPLTKEIIYGKIE